MMMLENERRRLYRILELPKHLQTTVLTLIRLGVVQASDIASVTGRARAIESAYLNQLCTMKIALKSRRGWKAFFRVDWEGLDW